MSSARDALQLQIGFEDLVGGARIDVVGAGQHPALHTVLFHQVVDRRDRLLVRRGAGVEHVAAALLAFVLHRIEQDAVQLLEHRQHGFARHRGPAAEHRGALVHRQQLPRLFGEQRPVRCGIDHHRFQLLAQQAALGVLLLDQHQHDVFQRGLADRHGAGERMQDADLDGAATGWGLRLRRGARGGDFDRAERGDCSGGGAKPAKASTRHAGINWCHSLCPVSRSCLVHRNSSAGSPCAADGVATVMPDRKGAASCRKASIAPGSAAWAGKSLTNTPKNKSHCQVIT